MKYPTGSILNNQERLNHCIAHNEGLLYYTEDSLLVFNDDDNNDITPVNWIDWQLKIHSNNVVSSGDAPSQEAMDAVTDLTNLSYYFYKPTTIFKRNGLTNKLNQLDLNCTRYDIDRWQLLNDLAKNKDFLDEAIGNINDDHLIQNALPMLTETEREFLITGFSPAEQDEIYTTLENQ